jgi:hypothetical protein
MEANRRTLLKLFRPDVQCERPLIDGQQRLTTLQLVRGAALKLAGHAGQTKHLACPPSW